MHIDLKNTYIKFEDEGHITYNARLAAIFASFLLVSMPKAFIHLHHMPAPSTNV